MSSSKIKPILINGFPRSGTTYLALQLDKNYPNKVLYEPLHPNIGKEILIELKHKEHPVFLKIHKKLSRKYFFINYYKNFGEEIFKMILRYHPSLSKNSIIFDIKKLKEYLLFFKDFHIKSIRLHLYLSEDFIKDNWEVYHIIRYPIDVFCSFLKNMRYSQTYLERKAFFLLDKISKFLPTIIINYIFRGYVGYNARKLWSLFSSSLNYPKTYEESFVLVWTISNYFAVKSLKKKNIIVYEKPKDYNKLPFELKDKLRITIYPNAREKLAYKFEKIAKKLEIENEYEFLLKFFD